MVFPGLVPNFHRFGFASWVRENGRPTHEIEGFPECLTAFSSVTPDFADQCFISLCCHSPAVFVCCFYPGSGISPYTREGRGGRDCGRNGGRERAICQQGRALCFACDGIEAEGFGVEFPGMPRFGEIIVLGATLWENLFLGVGLCHEVLPPS